MRPGQAAQLHQPTRVRTGSASFLEWLSQPEANSRSRTGPTRARGSPPSPPPRRLPPAPPLPACAPPPSVQDALRQLLFLKKRSSPADLSCLASCVLLQLGLQPGCATARGAVGPVKHTHILAAINKAQAPWGGMVGWRRCRH